MNPAIKPSVPKNTNQSRPVRGSTTGRPVMVLLDVLGRRWVLRILWELREHRAATFRELQAACEAMSPNVLNSRLKELRAVGLVTTRDEGGYVLTDDGLVLVGLLLPISAWANGWARKHSLGTFSADTTEAAASKPKTAARKAR